MPRDTTSIEAKWEMEFDKKRSFYDLLMSVMNGFKKWLRGRETFFLGFCYEIVQYS